MGAELLTVADYNRAQIVIVGDGLLHGTIHNQGAHDTSSVLCGVVAVVPRGAVVACLEQILEAFAWSDGTLLNRRHSVIPGSLLLTESVPVHGGTFFGASDSIVDGDLDHISPICLYQGAGELAVDEDDTLVDTIRGNGTPFDGEIVRSDHTGVGHINIRVGTLGGSSSPWIPLWQRVVGQELWVDRRAQSPVCASTIGDCLSQARDQSNAVRYLLVSVKDWASTAYLFTIL